MNKKALAAGLVYSLVVIAFKLWIALSGNIFNPIGLWSHLISILLIVPFFIYVVKSVRDGSYGGFIGGREAMRLALTVFAVGALITCTYNYIEFDIFVKPKSIEYYTGERFLEVLKNNKAIKPGDYQKHIDEMIKGASAFRSTTAKLMIFSLLSACSAFGVAMAMKKRPQS